VGSEWCLTPACDLGGSSAWQILRRFSGPTGVSLDFSADLAQHEICVARQGASASAHLHRRHEPARLSAWPQQSVDLRERLRLPSLPGARARVDGRRWSGCSRVLADEEPLSFRRDPAKAIIAIGRDAAPPVEYTKYFNRRYSRSGTLWNGRYRSKTIDDERYWLNCVRYVEANPVEAKIVETPESYEWTSYRVHAAGEVSDWLVPHHLYLRLGQTPDERQMAYRALWERDPVPDWWAF
jgi:hypothetical protein